MGKNICRLFQVLPQFPFTASETELERLLSAKCEYTGWYFRRWAGKKYYLTKHILISNSAQTSLNLYFL